MRSRLSGARVLRSAGGRGRGVLVAGDVQELSCGSGCRFGVGVIAARGEVIPIGTNLQRLWTALAFCDGCSAGVHEDCPGDCECLLHEGGR